MLAKDVLTEEWLADVLQDSLDVDWTPTDGARAIMRALGSATILPQCGGQIATVALAIQPATSQEEADWRVVLNTARQPVKTREDMQTALNMIESVAAKALAATPTPPTLSEDLREAIERLLLTMSTRALRGRDHVPSMRDEQTAASALRVALATQPATSQEGEQLREADAQDRRLAGMVALFRQSPDIHNPEQAAADIFERLFRNEKREDLQEAAIEAGARAMCDRVNYVGDYDENIAKRRSGWLPQARACITAFLAATPTPPTLSEDLRELVGTGHFILDRLVDHEVRMTSDDDAREWYGHVTPAMERFRAALAQVKAS